MTNPDLAVLVVHGIGTQHQGDTLNRFVDPLYRTLDGFCRSTATETSPGTPRPRFVDNPPDPDLRSVRLAVADRDNSEHVWLIAESWWADAFDVPDRSEFARWMFTFAPMFVFEQLVRIARRAASRPASARRLSVTYALKFVAAVVLTVIAALVSALISVLMFALFLVGLLPGKWTAWIRKQQLALAGSVGDTYAFLGNPRRRRVMLDKIHADLTKLLESEGVDAGTPVAIVAHSQGAALTHLLLGELFGRGGAELVQRQVTYVTYGGAIGPYAILTDVLTRSRSKRVLRTLFCLGAMASAAVAITRAVAGSLDITFWGPAVGSVVLGAVAVGFAFRSVFSQEKPNELLVPPAQRFRWCDFWSTVDPVPNGSLNIGSTTGGLTGRYSTARPTWEPGTREPVSYETTNRLQPWGDHSAYVADDEDFMTRVILELGRLSGWQNLEEDPVVEWPAARTRDEETALQTARENRRRRGFALLASQAVLVGAFIAAALVYWGAVAELGRLVDRNAPEFVRSAVGAIVDLIPEAVRDFFLGEDRSSEVYIGLGTMLVALAVAFAVGVLLWSQWQTAATRVFRNKRRAVGAWTQILGPAFVVFVVLVISGAWVSAWKLDDVTEVPDTGKAIVRVRLVAGFEDCTAGDDCPDLPVPGEVIVTELQGEQEPRRVPVERGQRLQLELEPGFYTITATSPGLGDCDQRSLDLRKDQPEPDPFDLHCDAGSRVSP